MVSLRRRKLLGFCSGISSSKVELPRYNDNSNASENPIQCSKSVTVHPIPSMDIKQPVEINNLKPCPASSNLSGTSSSKEAQEQRFFGHEVKRRKRHRRKHFDNHEPCIMRGVYFKNMKWQAAIKVDKKQIHLGTVGTQEEAAHLYDRAAFMCGREPNFELSEEVKRELRQLKWDDFLEITRQTITNKKHERRLRAGSQKTEETPMQNGTWVTGFSATVLEPDVSAP